MKYVLIFGEVLYDRFENGNEKRGGAPFNVAWHLHGFAQNPIFCSRVGDDSGGQKLLKCMTEWGLITEAVQVDADKPTGYVNVFNKDTDPRFDIIHDVAYDFIDSSELGNMKARLIYHGSLAMRNQISRNTFDQILKSNPDAKVFFDVNLRPPWSDIKIIKQYLMRTTYFKCNEAELETISTHLIPGKYGRDSAAQKLIHDFNLEALIVTLGDKGAMMYKNDDKIVHVKAIASVKSINSVGAGDAFSAVMIMGIRQGWPDTIMLNRANRFAASICTIDGAVPDTKKFYNNLLKRWK